MKTYFDVCKNLMSVLYPINLIFPSSLTIIDAVHDVKDEGASGGIEE